jgi:predicted secreted protein
MGMQVDSDSDDSSFKFESDGQDDDPDADADFDDEDDEDVKPSGSKKKVSVANRSNGRTMDLAGLRKKRAEDNKRRKEAAEPLMKIKREMMKKLKRKLTWAEINSVALNYVGCAEINTGTNNKS